MTADQTNRDGATTDAAHPDWDSVDTSHQRAVVAIQPMITEPHTRSRLADAMFLAHMFATKFRAPQTCAKRRAEPADAEASYRRVTQPAVRTGRLLSRKV